MHPKLLQYDSLKSVIMFLEPNFRIYLARRIPSIRIAEKGTSLKLDFLYFGDKEIVINRTNYKLSIYRKYYAKNSPFEKNGPVYEIDEFGCRLSPDNRLLPGDVIIENRQEEDVIEADEQYGILKEELEECQRQLKNNEENGRETKRLKRKIDDLRARLLPFEYRRKQQKAPCDLYTQLTVRHDEALPTLYRIPYTARLYEAMKHLIKVMFGDRREMWKVERIGLHVPLLRWLDFGILPVVRDLKIQNIESTNMESLRSIVHPSSFPLHRLEYTMSASYTGNFNNEIITKATELEVTDSGNSEDQWLPQLLKFHNNTRVHLKLPISPRDLYGFVSHWLEQDRPIGSCYTFYFSNREPKVHLDRIKKRPEVFESYERLVKLSMKNSSALTVSYEEAEGVKNIAKWSWVLKMEVVHRTLIFL